MTLPERSSRPVPSGFRDPEGGYVLLISVLVVGAVGTAIAVSLLWLGIGSARTGIATQQRAQAWALANACAEEALQQIRSSSAFSGTGALSLGAGSCSYVVTNSGGSARTISVSGTVGSAVRRASVSVTAISPSVVVSSWREVAD